MADFELRITGLAELERALEEMPLKASRRIVRTEATAATKEWADEMRATVHRGPHHRAGGGVDFGLLAANIVQKTTVRNDLSCSVHVGPAAAAGNYRLYWAKFVEFGTKMRHRKSGAKAGIMPAFPFIRPAFESRARDVLAKFTAGIRSAIIDAGMRLS